MRAERVDICPCVLDEPATSWDKNDLHVHVSRWSLGGLLGTHFSLCTWASHRGLCRPRGVCKDSAVFLIVLRCYVPFSLGLAFVLMVHRQCWENSSCQESRLWQQAVDMEFFTSRLLQIFELQAEIAAFFLFSFFLRNTIFIWKANWRITFIQTWVAGRHFLVNEQHEPVTSRHLMAFIANDNICPFKQKWEFWKICVCHCALNSVLVL